MLLVRPSLLLPLLILPGVSNHLPRDWSPGAVDCALASSAEKLWAHHRAPDAWDHGERLVTVQSGPCPSPHSFLSSHFRALGSLNLAWEPSGEGKVIWLCVCGLPHSWHKPDAPGEARVHWPAAYLLSAVFLLRSCLFPARG